MKILSLTVYTHQLQKQLKFYGELLGLPIKNKSKTSFEVVVGFSLLRFEQSNKATPYHIAFHIPGGQEAQGVNWIESRTTILKNGTDKIVDFSNWNAKSIYFYDEDKNIMELIARDNFLKPKSDSFSAGSILGISEIGLATNSIEEKYKILKEKCGLQIFDGNFAKFCAIGQPLGLIITINKNKKDWFPTNDTAYVSDFTMKFELENRQFCIEFRKDLLQISENK